MTKQLGLFDIPSFSAINLPPREDRDFREFEVVVRVGSCRLVRMVVSGYYYVEQKVDIVWCDSDLPAYTDEIEAFIHFGRHLESEYKEAYNSRVSNAEESQ